MPTQPKLVLSTCGTSLLMNAAGPLRGLLTTSSNAREGELSDSDRRQLGDLVRQQGAALRGADVGQARRMSAELNGLAGLYEGQLVQEAGRPDHQVLLHTDTYVGQACAELLAEWLRTRGFTVELQTTPGLATRSLEDFQSAMGELAPIIQGLTSSWAAKGAEVVFNLTGGFKSVQGFLQALGMLYADRCVYLFEAPQSELLVIPRLPLRTVPEESMLAHFDVIRRLANHAELAATECAEVPETLLFAVGGRCTLSAWGQAVWGEVSRQEYARQLQEPLSGRLRLGEPLRRSAADLPPDQRRNLNLLLDRLARCLDTGQALRSVTIKPVRGQAPADQTHEVYCDVDGAEGRLFGHWEQDVFVAESLGEHLR